MLHYIRGGASGPVLSLFAPIFRTSLSSLPENECNPPILKYFDPGGVTGRSPFPPPTAPTEAYAMGHCSVILPRSQAGPKDGRILVTTPTLGSWRPLRRCCCCWVGVREGFFSGGSWSTQVVTPRRREGSPIILGFSICLGKNIRLQGIKISAE